MRKALVQPGVSRQVKQVANEASRLVTVGAERFR
jgi:hypothetical protein